MYMSLVEVKSMSTRAEAWRWKNKQAAWFLAWFFESAGRRAKFEAVGCKR